MLFASRYFHINSIMVDKDNHMSININARDNITNHGFLFG